MRHWIRDADERDRYEQQLRNEAEAEQRRAQARVDDLTDDELKELQRDATGAGRSSLRAELSAAARSAGEPDG
ncbi:hypothetical protein [Streptomyces coeruleorubidus]